MITPERWQQIEEIFQEAVELPPDQVSSYLDRMCGADAELRHEVECLIESDRSAQENLAAAIHSAAGSLAEDVEKELPSLIGRRIGPYEIVREIGRGGMGTVYQAIRADDQYLRSVAIKFVARGVESARTLSRIKMERQILATLQHPNIAGLLDGGTTPEGQPYIVMEYIQGEPLLEYARRNKLSVEQRIELFCALCGAVQYAHSMLVIHRDIKPGNVLVTNDGVPKLLDFGIAKLMTPELLPGGEAETRTVHRMLTPDYASPEQIRGESLTTATDIYSLGVLLFELLTQSKPYRTAGRSTEELMRSVCDSEPLRLTQVAGADARLRRELAGDLENIVSMALRKEPQRRYASVQQFSDDLQRYLEGMPVSARSDTLFYRASKLIARNRLATAAFALCLVAVLAGWISTVRESRRTERRFQEVRKLANAVLFDIHNKIQGLPGSTPAREMLVRTALTYLNNLSQDAQDDLDLLWDISQAYEQVGDVQGDPAGANLGQFREALISYRRARELVESVSKRRKDDDVYGCLTWLHYKIGDLEVRTESPAGAIQSYSQGIKVVDRLSGKRKDDMLRNGYQRLSAVRVRTGDVDGAIQAARQAAAVAQRIADRNPGRSQLSNLARIDMLLGNTLWLNGDLDSAWKHLESAVNRLETVAATNRRDTGVLGDLQEAYRRAGDLLGNPSLFHLGRFAEAQDFQTKALKLARELAERDPRNAKARSDLSIALRRLAAVLRATRPLDSVQLYSEAITLLDSLLADAPGDLSFERDLANARLGRGIAYALARRTATALDELNAALKLQTELLARNPARIVVSEDMLDTRLALGDLQSERNDVADAAAHYQEALRIAHSLVDKNKSRLYAERCLALAYQHSGEFNARRARFAAPSDRQRYLALSKEQMNGALRIWSGWRGRKLAEAYASHREREVLAVMRASNTPVDVQSPGLVHRASN